MKLDEILDAVDQAFGPSPRPEHFTDFLHCDECAEHDELLRSRDRETLTVEDVGNPGWDPLTASSPAGIAYFMPKLVRMAVTDQDGSGVLWFAGHLMTHFWHGGRYNKCLSAFNGSQRATVVALAEFLINERSRDSGPYAEDPPSSRLLDRRPHRRKWVTARAALRAHGGQNRPVVTGSLQAPSILRVHD